MISGVVLAAGTGSRFGATKQLVEVEGKPLVRHPIDALREAGVDELFVVVGHDQDAVRTAVPADVKVVSNPDYRDGQATSLAAALHAVDDTSEAVSPFRRSTRRDSCRRPHV
jgi:CTP:molybdopterin cytidylyltransferase MocA